jgi:UDP-N-acetylmuramyl pentapeptide phosphotransferase/UDP-N-acetylglucosamine-1-phosphate transferase
MAGNKKYSASWPQVQILEQRQGVKMLHLLVLSFVVSAITGWFVVRWQDVHARVSGDHSSSSDHKIHKGVIPRVGGVVVITGWIAGLLLDRKSVV